ncbi:MAG: glycosyltransferase [Bacteroidetes bacterium]|nr:MAG: glycosyltransferase [Bacteroidota bacterium]
MKILFLSHRIPWPLRDGGAIAIYNNILGLKQAGHVVKLLCLNPQKDQVDTTSLPSLFSDCGLEYISIDTSIKPLAALLNLFGSGSYNAARFANGEFASLIELSLEVFNPDWVHIEGAFAAQYIDVIKANQPVPCVLREHNVEYEIWQEMAAGEQNPLKKFYLNLLASRLKTYEEALWQKFDLIFSITEEDAGIMRKRVGDTKVFNGGVGFDLSPYLAVTELGDSRKAYHLASMDWLPNQEAVEWTLNEIWPAMYSAMPEMELYLAGKKMPERFLNQNGGKLHIEAEVADVQDYSRDKGLMLVPLRSGSGIRIKTIEAMAMGKVVISTRRGLQGLGAQSGEHLLEANTAEEFAEAAALVQSDEALRQNIAQKARQFALENFELSQVIERNVKRCLSLLPTA